MKKSEEIRMGTLARAGNDEPVFVLRGKDKLSPFVIRTWAAMAELLGAKWAKVNEARQMANEIERWQNEHGSKVPD